MMRRYAKDAGPSWRKSWGWRDPDTVTVPDAQDIAEAEAWARLRRGYVGLFWLVCLDVGAVLAFVVTR